MEKRKQTEDFRAGILIGIAGTLVLTAICFCIYIFGSYFVEEKSSLLHEGTGTDLLQEESSFSLDEIGMKVTLLEKYIDAYYMDPVNKDNYADGIYKGIVMSLGDPYSAYYTAEEYADMMESSNGKYVGIGASVKQDAKTGVITIVEPFADSPAYEVGILPNDIIYKVEGEEVTGEDLTQVVGKMKGKGGTKVTLEIIREGENEPLSFEVERRMVEKQTINYEMLEQDIGYIKISEFDEVTAEQFRKALKDLEKQKQKGLIIDLRNNGGGRLEAVVDMLDRMLPKGMIVLTEDKNGEGKDYESSDKESFSKPTVVLINGNSASASEVFAGAIQDYKLGTLVGTTSFGKGIVQSVIPLEDGSAIKLTTSKYFTPNGRNIHGTGIEPDVEVELREDLRNQVKIEKKEDNQLGKALEILEGKIRK